MNLRPYQVEAVDFLTARRRAFLVAPAGSGKTIIGSFALMQAGAERFAWVANTKEQVEQSQRALSLCNLEGLVCCMMARPNLSSYDHVVIDECFPAGTLVDGTPIEKLKMGDSVSAFDHASGTIKSRPIRHLFRHTYRGAWVRLTFSHGQFVCTASHPVFIEGFGYVPAAQVVNYHKYGQVPKALRHVRKDIFCDGETQESPAQILQPSVSVGVHDNDAPAAASGTQVLAVWCSGHVPLTQATDSCRPRRKPSVLQPAMQASDHGRGKLASDDQDESSAARFNSRADDRGQSDVGSRDAGKNASLDARQNISFPRRERAANPTATSVARAVQTSDGVWDFDDPGTRPIFKSSALLQSGLGRPIREAGYRSGREKSSTPEVAFFGRAQNPDIGSSRLVSAEIYERGSGPRPNWVPREDTVYNLEVEEFSNYFADGILVHNCHHAPAAVWGSVIGTVREDAVLWGLSATPFGDDEDRNDFLKVKFEDFMFIERDEVMAGGHLVSGRVIAVDIDKPFVYDVELKPALEAECKRWRARYRFIPEYEIRKRVQWQMTQEHLQNNTARNAAIVNIARAEMQQGEVVIILVASIEHGERLVEQIEGSAILTSKLPAKLRRQRVEDLRAGRLRCAVATSLLDEGADFPIASVLILAAGGRSSTKTVQRAGRVMRPHAGKECGVVYDFIDRGLAHANAQWKARRRTYLDLGYSLEEPISF